MNAPHPPDAEKDPVAPPTDWDPTARTRDLAHQLVGWQSETGTTGEALFADHLADLLRQLPYFRGNPQDVMLIDSHGMPMTRNVVAIVRGSGPGAVAMAGHYDTASVANYHELAALACQPEALARALIADLSTRALSGQEARALQDLQSGDFVPGRAMLDMKSGLAAGIAVLEHFSTNPVRQGNLIFIATPDEERESRGMRSLRRVLPALLRDRGITIVAGLNLDATSDQGDGDLGRAVYAGTIGKLLPFALVVGQSSHASYPYEGISAQLIGAEILCGLEGNAALANTRCAEPTPPPICLEARDLRDGYEVTTPERFWLAFNWLFHSESAVDVFTRFHTEVAAAAGRAVARFADQAAAFGAPLPPAATAGVPVLTLNEVRARAFSADSTARARFAALEHELAQSDNPLELTRRLTALLVDAARIKGPAIVIGFAGLYYPPSRLDPHGARDTALQRAVDAALATVAHDPDCAVRWRPIFHGISDMSFFGQHSGQDAFEVRANTPATRLIDDPAPDALVFPVVNIGPWGREFHQRLERLHAGYGFTTLPRLLGVIVQEVLRNLPE